MLESVEDVIKAVGGNAAAAGLAGVRGSAVSNWKARKRIPAEFLLTFSEVLAREGLRVDPAVFGARGLEEVVK
jgi:DNA-binding transcriptional regulator YdaS (Cro superfamily)